MKDFSITITPRFYETDAQGHISNVTLAAWFEVLRTRILQEIEIRDGGVQISWLLASMGMDYVAETFYGSDVTLKLTDIEAGNSSLKFHCEMYQDDRLTVKAKAVLVHLDLATRKSQRIADDVRKRIAKL